MDKLIDLKNLRGRRTNDILGPRMNFSIRGVLSTQGEGLCTIIAGKKEIEDHDLSILITLTGKSSSISSQCQPTIKLAVNE
jgi:hypothetical protein